MRDFKFEMGVEAEDIITGYKGIITGRVQYITGCYQYLIQPKCKDNKKEDPHWFDEDRMEIKSNDVKINLKNERNGFGEEAPIK